MQDNQFYPTPIGLAIRAKSLFKNKKIVRMLEPFVDRYEKFTVDCIEIDLSNKSTEFSNRLSSKAYNSLVANLLESMADAA